MPSYRLDTQPWIPVVLKTGTPAEVSLLDAIERAPGIRTIAGNPLEVAVLARLLVAIAHAVRQPQDPYEWLDIWHNRRPLLDDMAAHVVENAGLFDLYDPERPFAQHPRLPVPGGPPALLEYERAQGNNPVFLDHSRVSDPVPLPSAAAARALLVTHSYGGSGTGGLNPLNSGKKDQMRAGPLCARLIALLEGEDLAKTIVLNLASDAKPSKPGWLRERADAPGQTPPDGPADLYTRATRSARLLPSEDGLTCTAVSLFMGEAVAGADDGGDDPMIPRYLASDKKFKALRLSGDRAMWRSAHVLLTAAEKPFARPVRALEQLRPLASDGLVSTEEPVRLRVLGVEANAQGPATDLWRDETLPFGLSVLTDDARYAALERAVAGAEETARKLRGRLYRFALAYLRNGGDSSPDSKDAGRLADELAPNLAGFWSGIGPRGERIALDDFDDAAWEKELAAASERAFRKAIDRLPPDARRLRAEFARAEAGQDTLKGGKKTA